MVSPAAVISYNLNGSICCLISLLGTLGNIVSFIYFKSKKKDISSFIYLLITANDIVVSITTLPVGISALEKGQPGILFGNKYGCEVWYYVWTLAIKLSVFLVLCLCVTRTISMLRPFRRQSIKCFVFAVVMYMVINIAFEATFYSFEMTVVMFTPERFRCNLFFKDRLNAELSALTVNYNISYITPALTVAISCVISVVVLTRKNRNVQQRELQQSRNRATVTILLFALLYGACNVPLAFNFMASTFCVIRNDWKVCSNLLKFDKHLHYRNAIFAILPSANSAANPILYFWRMPALRVYFMTGIRRKLRLNRAIVRPVGQQTETQSCNRVIENSNIAERLTASRHLDTAL